MIVPDRSLDFTRWHLYSDFWQCLVSWSRYRNI